MSNLIINIRFGTWHLQVGSDHPWFVCFKRNAYWWEVKPRKWFEVYKFFNYKN